MPLSFAEIALPLPLPGFFTYAIPPSLAGAVGVGARVLVPFGRKRQTGYVVRLTSEAPTDFEPKPIAEVLDATPLFEERLLGLFQWAAEYYHASLGELIRTGLPAGLQQSDERVVSASEPALEALRAVLDTTLDAAERPVIEALANGPMSWAKVTALPGATAARLQALEQRGLVSIVVERKADRTKEKTEDWAVWLGESTKPPVSKKEAAIVERLQGAGELPVKALREEFGRVKPNLDRLLDGGAIALEARRAFRELDRSWSSSSDASASKEPPVLNPAQREAVSRVTEALASERGGGFLLYGVTGSGKTEVYLHIIAEALERGAGAIVLVPEIALTPQLLARFEARFGEKIAVLHSALSAGARYDEWARIQSGEKPVVIGARSALFAPVQKLGAIVIDEEQVGSFKQGERPRYHARDLALVRGHLEKCPVVLGSATPSLESWFNAGQGKLQRLDLPERARASAMPEVELVDMRAVEREVLGGIVSAPLAEAMRKVVAAGEQVIVLLNRRGYSNFVLCKACGEIPQCPDCSISLTYTKKMDRLRCHYCGFSKRMPPKCPQCRAEAVEPIGVGTEKAEAEIQGILGAEFVVERMDRDTAKGAELPKLLNRFRDGEIHVLVGTQMVAKGHDFPNVTLVGVLSADQSLRLPDFRASERAFQLIAQVAGRAGRGDRPGRVLVQTYNPDHPALEAAVHHDYEAFAAYELAQRRERNFPPHCYLALILVTHPDPRKAVTFGESAAREVRSALPASRDVVPDLWVLGPTWAPVQRIKGKTRVHVLLKSRQRSALHRVLAHLDRWSADQNLAGTVSVDVDPIHLI